MHINNVSKLAAGHEHSLALTKTQELYAWGTGSLTGLDVDQERIGIPTHLDFSAKAVSKDKRSVKIAAVSCGGLHTAVITQDGDLYTWGSTEGGQLGHEDLCDQPSVRKPTRVESLAA